MPAVFFLECDVGQTEFTPPGVISLSRVDKPLLGPPFTHQKEPVAYVAKISSMMWTYFSHAFDFNFILVHRYKC